MNDKGWISLHRQIQDHFLYKEKRVFSRFEAWIDLILSANHAENKFLFSGELIKVDKGQFITSEVKLMAKWGWSKSKVRLFLNLLVDEQMIIKVSDKKKTTITIVKYEVYQDSKTTEKPQKDHRKTTERPLKDTNNNDNNDNNTLSEDNVVKAFDFKKALIDYGFDEELVNAWLEVRKLKKGKNTKIAFDGFIREVQKITYTDINSVLRTCIEHSWCGFESSWYFRLKNELKTDKNGKQLTENDLRDFINRESGYTKPY